MTEVMRLADDLKIPSERAGELRDLLLQRPDETLFHLSVLEERGTASRPGEGAFAFVGWPQEGPLRAAAFVAGSWFVSPFAIDPRDAAAMGRALAGHLLVRRAIGERAATDALWAELAPGRLSTALRHDQSLMLLRAPDAADLVLPGLRPAEPHEEELVFEAAARMQTEELGVDPRLEDPVVFRTQVQDRARAGRTFVLVVGGELRFKADVALRCKRGAQIGGVWVPPEQRGRGLASRGTCELARRLLATGPVVSLHVHEKNLPAVAAYKRAGFRHALPFRLFRGEPAAGAQAKRAG